MNEDEMDEDEMTKIADAFSQARENSELSAEWTVDRILGRRTINDNSFEYLVAWKKKTAALRTCHYYYNE